ncbi:TPA: transposase [Bacillus cereus]|nr:transposase [Bacillus cereus]
MTSIRKGLFSKKIHDDLIAQGYTGSPSTTRYLVRELKKELNQKKKFSFFISRYKIIRLIFNQKADSTVSAEHIEEILNNYPLVRELLTLLYQFQKILTKRQTKRFTEWIHQVEQLSVPELKSFINGIKRDWEAVFHACAYPLQQWCSRGECK